MRKLIAFLFITLALNGLAQERKYSTFYEQRASLFNLLPVSSDDIVFVGNSITNGGEWHELFEDKHIKNRGISGDISEGVYDRLESITKGKPKKIFLMIGTNDIAKNIPINTIAENIEKIILKIKEDSPETGIYMQSVLPVNPDFKMFSGHMKPDSIKSLNRRIEKLSHTYNTVYIDLYPEFLMQGTDKLSPRYTNDGLHLLGEGYLHWAQIVSPYIKENNMNSTIERLLDYPIHGGVSAPFAGVHNNMLIVAGGCNFPDVPASDGGSKDFYDDIFYLDTTQPQNGWTKSFSLLYKVAYGSSVTTRDGIICIGGQNEKGAINKVVRIYFDKEVQKIKTEDLPSLPVGIFNAGTTLINDKIYITGGVSSEGKSDYIYSLDMNDIKKGWQRINTNQTDERQQPVVFAQNGNLFMAGGYDEKNAKVFSDVLKFNLWDNKWYKFSVIGTEGSPQTFIGSGSVNLSSSCTVFTGGADYEIFTSALKRIKSRQEAVATGNTELAESLQKAGKEYMTQPADWYKFHVNLLTFDAQNKEWKSLGDFPQSARAGAGIAIHGNELYIICGELKPGIRTAEVNKIILNR